MKPWKRSDISERIILEVYSRHIDERWPADEVLAEVTGAPRKVILAAIWRECDRGNIDYGTTLRSGWITEKGTSRLNELATMNG